MQVLQTSCVDYYQSVPLLGVAVCEVPYARLSWLVEVFVMDQYGTWEHVLWELGQVLGLMLALEQEYWALPARLLEQELLNLWLMKMLLRLPSGLG